MGEDPVILARDLNGQLRAHLNMCRHRGNRVCRADRGNTKLFQCSYHGWSYTTDGKLALVPMVDAFGNLDRSQWGLVPVAQIDSYKGLIFATFDAEAPALRDYLGDMAWYLDILLDRREGGTEVSGPHRWMVDANWKTAAENFGGDGYHIASTHGSARELGIDTTTSQTRQWNKGCQIACGNGHILVSWLTPPDGGPWFAQPDDQLVDYMKEHAAEIENRLGTNAGAENLAVGWNGIPEFVGALADPDDPRLAAARAGQDGDLELGDRRQGRARRKSKTSMRFVSQYRFSPSGVFEQDDMDNWIQVTGAARSLIGRRFPANYQMSGNEPPMEFDLPGRVKSRFSDNNQLSLYMHWAKMLQAKNWRELASGTNG